MMCPELKTHDRVCTKVTCVKTHIQPRQPINPKCVPRRPAPPQTSWRHILLPLGTSAGHSGKFLMCRIRARSQHSLRLHLLAHRRRAAGAAWCCSASRRRSYW